MIVLIILGILFTLTFVNFLVAAVVSVNMTASAFNPLWPHKDDDPNYSKEFWKTTFFRVLFENSWHYLMVFISFIAPSMLAFLIVSLTNLPVALWTSNLFVKLIQEIHGA